MNSKLPSTQVSQKSLAELSPIQLYLREIARYPLLSPEEEYDLAVRQFDKGDVKAAHRLVTANLRLVVKIANDFRQTQSNFLDLIQEGNYGLMQAVKKFNPYKGVRLSTYSAWWIKAFILRYIMENHSQVKIGTTAAQRKLYFNLRKEAEKLLLEYDRVDTKLLAENLDVKEQEVIEMQQRLGHPDVSLDTPLNDGSDRTRGALIPDDAETQEDLVVNTEIKEIFAEHLEEFAQQLQGRDLEIFESRIIADNPLTLHQIGEAYGVTRERARQLEARILKKLHDFVKDKGKLIDL